MILFLINFSGGLKLLQALGQAARVGAERSPPMVLLYVSVGLLQLAAGILHTPELANLGPGLWPFHAYILCKLLVGPSVYFYFRSLFETPGATITKRTIAHFPPALLYALAALVALAGGAEKPGARQALADHGSLAPWLMVGTTLYIGAYITYFLIRFRFPGTPEFSSGAAPSRVFIITAAIIFVVMAGVELAGTYLANTLRVNLLLHLATSFVLAFSFVMSVRYPDLRERLRENIRSRYARSKLRGVDLDDLGERLERLMREEKLYLDESLSLSGVAEKLGVSPHQLSEYLNEKLGRNFPTYVNRHRIEEARRLLIEEPDRTVLSISLEVGFNSYTTFNSVFRKEVGQSPGRFKKTAAAAINS